MSVRSARLTLVAGFLMGPSTLTAQESPEILALPPLPAPIEDTLPPQEETAEEVPPETEDVDVSWYEPTYWLGPTPWDAGVQLGINAADGNSESFSLQVGTDVKRTTDDDKAALELLYNKASADNVETQNNAYFKGRYDRDISDTPWLCFAAGTVTYDEFQAFDIRLAANGGIGYHFIQNEQTTLTGRFGGGASREFGGPDDDTVPEAVYSMDFERQWTKRQKSILEAEYFPSWMDYNDYRLVAKASWEIMIDEQSNTNLKISIIDRYDSTPNGRRPNDLNYALLLLWKL